MGSVSVETIDEFLASGRMNVKNFIEGPDKMVSDIQNLANDTLYTLAQADSWSVFAGDLLSGLSSIFAEPELINDQPELVETTVMTVTLGAIHAYELRKEQGL